MSVLTNENNLFSFKVAELVFKDQQNNFDDDVKLLRPLSKLSSAPPIADMKWILNDTFLAVMTPNNCILFFDVLLQDFQIIEK